ncbi:redoxin family protein [Methyloceanibacter sp. wino2]|uniref:redoxin family protein n=1 Tax=Methyloceanibacter sp. wino2 TaxID=2170729 RepID=UPI00131EDD66|nr:redoxin family protein [Methyloceanibacter sp. wino2]
MFDLISHAGARLFAVSGQSTAFQREMALRLELPFPILSDAEGALRRALHLPTFEAGPESYLKRLTFVVRDGQIEHVFFPIEDPEAHAAEVVDWLKDQA